MGGELRGKDGAVYLGCSIAILLVLFSFQAFGKGLSETGKTGESSPVRGLLAEDMDENSLYDDCRRAYSEGKIAEVCEKSKHFLMAFPQSRHRPEIIFMQAQSELLINVAVQKYELLIADCPENEWVEKSHLELIRCYYLLSEYDKTVSHYQTISPSPQNDNIRYWMARCLLSKGEHKDGKFILHGLRGLSGYEIALGVADSYFGKQEYDHAAELCEWVAETSEEDDLSASAHAQLCKILRQVGKGQEAQNCYQEIINKYPRTPEAQLARFYLQESQGSPLYVVQLGAFSRKKNAADLVHILKDKRYNAYFTTPESNDGKLRKVRIGPFVTKDDAKKAASKLRLNNGLPAIVLAVIVQ